MRKWKGSWKFLQGKRRYSRLHGLWKQAQSWCSCGSWSLCFDGATREQRVVLQWLLRDFPQSSMWWDLRFNQYLLRTHHVIDVLGRSCGVEQNRWSSHSYRACVSVGNGISKPDTNKWKNVFQIEMSVTKTMQCGRVPDRAWGKPV